MERSILVLVSVLVITAGCSGLNPNPADETDQTTTPPVTSESPPPEKPDNLDTERATTYVKACEKTRLMDKFQSDWDNVTISIFVYNATDHPEGYVIGLDTEVQATRGDEVLDENRMPLYFVNQSATIRKPTGPPSSPPINGSLTDCKFNYNSYKYYRCLWRGPAWQTTT